MIPISKPLIGEEEKRLVMQVLDSGMLVQGPRVAELEQQWAITCSSKHAIATSNGTTALHVALLAHHIGAGDEVITPSFTFVASVNSIIYTGARPVFADVCPDSFNVDPVHLEELITPKTKAILLVHLYGHPVDMDSIQSFAHKHNLIIIEDACQAIGATYDGKPIGSFGTGCFSLYATKNIMSGEGGMITTNDDEVARRCRLIRAHGMERRYYHDMLGFNFRMSDLHAAIGLAQIARLNEITDQRNKNAAFLTATINNPKVITPRIILVRTGKPIQHVWHQYTVRCINGLSREVALKHLTERGIGTGVFYPVPAHQQQHILDLGYGGVTLPVTEQLAREVFSLPVHPALSQEDLNQIVSAVNEL
ncbi:MAG: DegT/DnrJ/EryC1/StrS family aminotransferase [Anaerolineae bacterium]|nr:DegT/DnrJ/EryC1/StrS family aminotransferase [Anaerolineae bacterium]